LLAFVLRAVAHWYSPRGWRDDEFSEALVISQHVLDGDLRLYYADASGQEGLFHWLRAGTMAVFGQSVWGIRGPSIVMGTLAVLLVYLLTRRLFDWPTAAVTALVLAFSFWALMYSRSGQRQVSVTVTTLLSFYFLWKAMPIGDRQPVSPMKFFALAGLCMGIGFYTYFASRGLPLILIAWMGYLLVWRRDLWSRYWRGLLVVVTIAIMLAMPLAITLARQPQAEARVSEVARPVREALAGDFSMLGRYTLITLSMFTHDGDEEALYNIPHRPVFGLLGGTLFWCGVAISASRALGRARDPRYAFLLLWLGAGLTPGLLSVPAASLGHTILAQPVSMMMPALALTNIWNWLAGQDVPPAFLKKHLSEGRGKATIEAAALTLTLIFIGWEGIRSVYDYWVIWPSLPTVRELHHSSLHEAARWLNEHPGNQNVAIGGYLVERWDQQVMRIELKDEGWHVRAFNPRQAYLLIPGGGIAVMPDYLQHQWGDDRLGPVIPVVANYLMREIEPPEEWGQAPPLAHFNNGLALIDVRIEGVIEGVGLSVITGWRVDQPLDLPPFPLMSKPPAPGQDPRPRLAIFVQLLDGNGQWAAGADGLGVDPYTLLTGDVFFQQSVIELDDVPPGTYQVIIGLYNPVTGERRLDELTGRDRFEQGNWQRP
jgi:hypothetical protein